MSDGYGTITLNNLFGPGYGGQVTTDVPLTIYQRPDPSSPVVGTFMPGLVMVKADQITDPATGVWVQLQEAVLDLSQPDTIFPPTNVGWVSQAEAAALGGSVAPTQHVPPYETPFPGQGVVTAIGNAITGIASALPSFGSGLILVLAVGVYALVQGSQRR